jgi:CheY-like chemotaxis protein/anti-sigma regulatory factor (Ser/Thr protein kinase)
MEPAMTEQRDASAGNKPSLLIVDDEKVVRSGLQIVFRRRGYETVVAENGLKAYELLESRRFDTVLSDIEMPKCDGLELLRKAKQIRPDVPFVMITGKANMDYTIRALRLGAVNFVRKPYTNEEILGVVSKAMAMAIEESQCVELMQFLQESKSLTVPSRMQHLRGLLYFLLQNVPPAVAPGPTDRFKMRLALDEAITNAHEHGNMECEGRNRDGKSYTEKLRTRQEESPYKDRHIFVACNVTGTRVEYTVRDEGPGFDHRNLPDPNDSENLFRLSGRGVMLMRLAMDEVRFNDKGNEVVMVRNERTAEPEDGPGTTGG